MSPLNLPKNNVVTEKSLRHCIEEMKKSGAKGHSILPSAYLIDAFKYAIIGFKKSERPKIKLSTLKMVKKAGGLE